VSAVLIDFQIQMIAGRPVGRADFGHDGIFINTIEIQRLCAVVVFDEDMLVIIKQFPLSQIAALCYD
jgi:hypothetical protein